MSVPIKMKITKEKLQQIIKEEYQRALSEGEHEQDMYPGADERGDPDNWDHFYDDDKHMYDGKRHLRRLQHCLNNI